LSKNPYISGKPVPGVESGTGGFSFDVTGQPLTLYSAFVKHLRKSGNRIKQCISY